MEAELKLMRSALIAGMISGPGQPALAQALPEAIIGLAQVYDARSFDLLPAPAEAGRYPSANRIRLEGVEGCEVRQKAELEGVQWPCGAVGAAWLVGLTLGKTVECRPTRFERGGDSAYRAQCFVDGRDLAAEGIRAGMLVMATPAGEPPLPSYAELEAEARAARRGIWSSHFALPSEWRRANGSYNPLAPSR